MKKLSPEVKRLAGLLYASIGTPVAQSLNRALERGDWEHIAESRVDPKAYSDAKSYFRDACVSGLLRKLEDLPTDPQKRRVKALANWKRGEADCFKTNERLAPYLEGFSHPSWNADVARHIDGVRKIVSAVLGDCPSLDDLRGKFGPGATFSDPAVRSTIADKMNVSPSMTPKAYWFLLPWSQTKWGRVCAQSTPWRGPSWVRGNRFATAPKDATKDRAIAAEPSINVYFQLSLGLEVRRRLKAAGIDLRNGQATHAQVARESSITGRFATLDLTNASDTLSTSLVKLLIPPRWFELFTELRSPLTRFSPDDLSALTGTVRDREAWWHLEKFSSMGNGFTFELETLIFFAIVHYVGMMFVDDEEIGTLVYGDDIICRTEIVGAVIPILNFFGFQINKEKSFWEGPFRESCGGDYFSGQAVRPYFMKESPDEPQDYIAAANAVRRAFEESPLGFSPARRAWFHLLDQLPIHVRRIRGPKSLGDLVVYDEEERWAVKVRGQSRYNAVYRPHRVLNGIPLRVFDDEVVLACALYGTLVGSGRITPRDPELSYKCGWIVSYGIRWVPDHTCGVGIDPCSSEGQLFWSLSPRSSTV